MIVPAGMEGLAEFIFVHIFSRLAEKLCRDPATVIVNRFLP